MSASEKFATAAAEALLELVAASYSVANRNARALLARIVLDSVELVLSDDLETMRQDAKRSEAKLVEMRGVIANILPMLTSLLGSESAVVRGARAAIGTPPDAVIVAATVEDLHRQRHVLLHAHLDELLADYLRHTGRTFSDTKIVDFLKWAHEQTIEPTTISTGGGA